MRRSIITTVCILLAVACGQGKPSAAELPSGGPQPSAAPTPTPTPTPAKPEPAAQPAAQAAPSVVEDATFTLRVAEAGPYKAGELGRFVVHLEPHGVYHVNQEYPIEIAVTGDADTAFPKAKLERPDAAEFGEKKAKFEVPFTAKVAGDHKVVANVKFAVCTKENCVPDERNLSLSLAVK